MTLRAKIIQQIREHGAMPFSRYMEICLYDPDHGYYSRSAGQFGKAGDFYTSSDIHAVFGRLFARQFDEMWRVLGSPAQIELLELGPGRGLFARDVLDWSQKKFPAFFEAIHYTLAETSPALRRNLESRLDDHFGSGKAGLSQNPPTRALPSDVPLVIFANEFFDALPVEILSSQGKLMIWENDGSFVENWATPSSEELAFLDRYGVQPEVSERIEAPLAAQQAIKAVADKLQRGFLIAIDYGYTQAEQIAGRHRGTLMTYRQHSASPNPYEAPGEQDITAHVNFTALTVQAEHCGLQVQPLVTQSQFLLGIGEENQFADAFEDCRLPQEKAKVGLQLKHLITPAGVGENFQVLVASRGVPQQSVKKLAGLNFGKHRPEVLKAKS